ncbi:MAG: Trk system potassium transporter TrkA [Halobacteriales archaeon]
MRLLVIGAGEVGSSIAASLADSHEVVVIDRDSERVEALTYAEDVLAITGDGTDLDVLMEAEVDAADLVIASTDDDETNLVICGTAETASDAFTIARVRSTALLDTWERAPGAFGVDFMVCTDLMAAEAIVRLTGLPAARDVDPFADGRVQMAEFEVPDDSPIAGRTVQEADRYEDLTFAALIEDDDVTIPRGDATIRAGSRIVVIGTPSSVRAFAGALVPEQDGADDVVVIGGGPIGGETARILEERGRSPRLIEADPERARALAEARPGTVVMEHDPTDAEFLAREHVDAADLVVVALDSDERSLMVALLAKQLGAARTVAVVENGDYVDLFETVGVDVALNPRGIVAEEITRFTRERRTENVALIESDRAEVVEIEVDDASVLAGRPIADAVADLPEGLVVGAIVRDGGFIAPRGATVIEPGDRVVVLLEADCLEDTLPRL